MQLVGDIVRANKNTCSAILISCCPLMDGPDVERESSHTMQEVKATTPIRSASQREIVAGRVRTSIPEIVHCRLPRASR